MSAPSRIVHCGDGIAFLRAARLAENCAIITSLPDHSELPELARDGRGSPAPGSAAERQRGSIDGRGSPAPGSAAERQRGSIDGWRRWFSETVALCCAQIADDAVAIFYQTDVKHDGRWVDKSHLVQLGADAAGSGLLWHKIVCRVPAGTTTFGRPAYAHMLAFSRGLRLAPGQSTPDVLPALGAMSWSRAMGMAACEAAVRFVGDYTRCTTIVDPFCGQGSALVAANARGMAAIGVELSRRRAARARRA